MDVDTLPNQELLPNIPSLNTGYGEHLDLSPSKELKSILTCPSYVAGLLDASMQLKFNRIGKSMVSESKNSYVVPTFWRDFFGIGRVSTRSNGRITWRASGLVECESVMHLLYSSFDYLLSKSVLFDVFENALWADRYGDQCDVALMEESFSRAKSDKTYFPIEEDVPLQYLGGFFDVKGSMFMGSPNKWRKVQYPSVSLCTMNYALVDYLARKFGGQNGKRITAKSTQTSVWTVKDDNAVNFIEAILPWMNFRRDEAQAILNW